MARPNFHKELTQLGFVPTGSYHNGSNDRIGDAVSHHYALTKIHAGVFPFQHHVVVNEYSRAPGKYDVSYKVTRLGQPYEQGNMDTLRRHRDNIQGGVRDPLGEIITHHNTVSNILRHRETPYLAPLKPETMGTLLPGQHNPEEIGKMMRMNKAARLMDQADEDLKP